MRIREKRIIHGVVSGMTFEYISSEEVDKTFDFLRTRFAEACAVKGTRGFHKYVPISEDEIEAYETSSSSTFKLFRTCRKDK